jgi:hypothetical protein
MKKEDIYKGGCDQIYQVLIMSCKMRSIQFNNIEVIGDLEKDFLVISWWGCSYWSESTENRSRNKLRNFAGKGAKKLGGI